MRVRVCACVCLCLFLCAARATHTSPTCLTDMALSERCLHPPVPGEADTLPVAAP
uniref:Uncharacterized protein n=1 Tax=Tetraselmis sp. GSL018 TaxID=582737 RepID=A0A061SJ74_9CHLO